MNIPKDLVAWSRSNWNKIHPLVRQDCLNELHSKVPDVLLKEWCAEYKAGKEIGSSDGYFHFGVGMAVRNALRTQLTDGELPFVKYDSGEEYQNWDDYYMGALQELVEQELAKS